MINQHDSAQIRRQGALDFMAYYDFACARQESVPLPVVKVNLDKGMLDFNGDRLKLTDWPPILSSISINKHLHHIAISSTYQANLGSGDAVYSVLLISVRSKDMTFKVCKALRECLIVSPNLKTLQLNGLPLRERDLIILTKGLSKNTSLENLSLANCPITDEGLEVICQSVKYSTSIRTIDFTGCSLTWRGAEHMANIIKHQGMQRHGTAWAESLRYRQPQFEGMGGLRRVTLNHNTLIGDRGAAALARELSEDLWVKAVDLQRCGLSNEGARRLLEALKTNSSLRVLDIRSNPLVGKHCTHYCWIKPATTEPQRTSGPKRRALPSTVRGKATFRIGICIYASCFSHTHRQLLKNSYQHNKPVKNISNNLLIDICVLYFIAKKVNFHILAQTVYVASVKQFRGRYWQSVKFRYRFTYELENARLRDAKRSLSEALAATGSASAPPAFTALEDEAVLESIENSFTKFHAFLDLLKDAGLGQLASMAGIDGSDFQPLGRPQLSSTVGPHLDGAALLTQGDCVDVTAKTDAASLVSMCKTITGECFQTQFSCLLPTWRRNASPHRGVLEQLGSLSDDESF
uniref:Centrosomal protein 78 n=1 Tax=Stegastes partitus TaxID=144197 RepID=A0A3B5ANR2_9TELE